MTVFIQQGLLRRDVGLQMLRNSLATVYEAKFGSEFGRYEKYREAERRAKERSVGMWAKPGLLEVAEGEGRWGGGDTEGF